MQRRSLVRWFLVAVLAVGGIGWFSLDRDTRAVLATLPTNKDLLFWTQTQRDAAFRALDKLPVLAKSHVVKAGGQVMPLPVGRPLLRDADVAAFMTAQRSAAVLIVQNDSVRLERYGLGFDSTGRWTSFSVAKSFTSTLVGAAIKDGAIRSLDDKVSAYVAGLQGSAYDDVTIKQLLTMTSGVRWNEDYNDPRSDVAKFNSHVPPSGLDAIVSYLRTLPRAAPAGTRWNYSTGETNLVGILISAATKKPLADYLSEKIWQPAGMAHDASWLLNSTGKEIGGCCLQAATRDYARYGLFVLHGARANGQSIVPDGWFAQATTSQADIGQTGRGYGFQWWTYGDGTYAARGIFGQGIFIDAKRNLVIALNASWPAAVDPASVTGREAFIKAVQHAVDAETFAAAPTVH